MAYSCPGLGRCSSGLEKVVGFVSTQRRAVVVVVTVVGLVKLGMFVRWRNLRAEWARAGKDVVVLHAAPRGNFCPSISTYSLKLETFLRMAGIQYQLDTSGMGPKGKIPWITLNGEDYSDSELIVQRLQVIFNRYPDANLPKEARAVGLAIRVMLEEHFNWSRLSWRFVEDNMRGLYQVQELPYLAHLPLMIFRRRVNLSLYMQGLGRHSLDEFRHLMKGDMEALSIYLGDKPFLFGDKPQVVDCSVFGCLCQIIYNMPGNPYLPWIDNDFPNLRSYTERMKQNFWPDWNQCIKKPELTQ